MSLTNATPEAAAREAKNASFALASLPASARNAALDAIHAALAAAKDDILAANARDLELAKKAAADGSLSEALVSRLDLGKKGKWEDMLKGITDVRDLEDPGTIITPDLHPFWGCAKDDTCLTTLQLARYNCGPSLTMISSSSESPAQLVSSSSSLRLDPKLLPTLPVWPSSLETRPFSKVTPAYQTSEIFVPPN
jgi:hypothetical protein